VSQIMDLHGGRVEVRSTEGKGSVFTLRFPYRAAEMAGPGTMLVAEEEMGNWERQPARSAGRA